MEETLSLLSAFAHQVGPFGAAIVVIILAIGLAIRYSNIGKLEIKSKLFNFSLTSKTKAKDKTE